MNANAISGMLVWCGFLCIAYSGGGDGGSTTPRTAPSALSYASPQSFLRGQPIAPLDPTVTGTVSAYSVTPALPAGLDLNTASGRISGTPSVATVEAAYTVAAQNATAHSLPVLGKRRALRGSNGGGWAQGWRIRRW